QLRAELGRGEARPCRPPGPRDRWRWPERVGANAGKVFAPRDPAAGIQGDFVLPLLCPRGKELRRCVQDFRFGVELLQEIQCRRWIGEVALGDVDALGYGGLLVELRIFGARGEGDLRVDGADRGLARIG